MAEFNVADVQRGDLVLNFDANCISGCGNATASASATNSGNGQGSNNNALVNQVGDSALLQNNNGNVGSNLKLAADSGNNHGNGNTNGNTTVTTGAANTVGNVLTFLNNNLAGKVIYGTVNIFGTLIGDIVLPQSVLDSQLPNCNSCSGLSGSASNSNNGQNSNNNATVSQSANNSTAQANVGDIQNNLNLTASTGANNASGNTNGNTQIESGKANVDAQGLNVVNTNVDGGNVWLVLVPPKAATKKPTYSKN